jgi:hypothetical protein
MCIGDQGSGMCWEKDWYMCSMMCIVCVRDVMCSRIGIMCSGMCIMCSRIGICAQGSGICVHGCA